MSEEDLHPNRPGSAQQRRSESLSHMEACSAEADFFQRTQREREAIGWWILPSFMLGLVFWVTLIRWLMA